MTTAEQNALLTQTGPGTPMGELFRRYWIPALLPQELPEPDCPPVRIQLLSERLLAFRDSQGRLGLIDEFCAHRGVSLWFGRNEEDGLRCPYHGWKYDVTGQCVDVPSEPQERGYCKTIKLRAYPLVEHGGVLWTYMGPPDKQPPLPAYEWATVPEGQRYVSKRQQDCNYLQLMEGGLDSFHSIFLHSMSASADPLLKRDPQSIAHIKEDPRPAFIPLESPGGLYIATRRNQGDSNYYWRVTQWLMPCTSLFPPYKGNPHGGHAWVPIDDEHAYTFSFDYHPDRPFNQEEMDAMLEGRGIHCKTIPGTFRPLANKDNDYLMDRQAQKEGRSYCGVMGFGEQDAAVQESMGPIEDRSKEHLVGTDKGIIMTRQRLLKAAKMVQEGALPPGLDAASQRVRAFSSVLPRDAALHSAPEMQVSAEGVEQPATQGLPT
ncbi:Rieske 2Fe-2S domain-containing protein [Pusillimonas noertemannii]|uniref:Rieske 2Fe-2S domain-containing protein n=1 Tax=Pusillimonas noertemannii TaxID=305977 RepID=UPI0002F33F3D|nr:Rieske 2Fe-2S domain-containing protein [Pusillimonas noertemannii]